MKKLLLAALLAYFPLLLPAQGKPDSLWQIQRAATTVETIQGEALNTLAAGGDLFPQPGQTLQLAYLSNQTFSLRPQFFLFTGGVCVILSLLVLVWFQWRKNHQNLVEQKTLQDEILALKNQIATLSLSSSEKQNDFTLNKAKIEDAIQTKLGESSWLILNLLFEDPTISNKAIAAKVSLSVEGVSSSLRRMYTTFNITSPNNKKIALIMKAIRFCSGT